ncbi:MAG: recombination protein RecR [Candidatus Aminicenantes bacterium]|nr:MAG: recombination protein RecR [Candidatus Aminicenantes bacterium]
MSLYEFTSPVKKLIEELKKIPGIGRKSAQRMCFYLLKSDKENALALANAIIEAREQTFFCSTCNNITSKEPCEICSGTDRETGKICVVEEPFNIYSIERTDLYKGMYHVLHGNLSPIKGIGPDELKISGLLRRLEEGHIEEVILATSPTTEGNATAHYLSEVIRKHNPDVKVTRLALGIPIGADIDYVDSVTIARAMEGRVQI